VPFSLALVIRRGQRRCVLAAVRVQPLSPDREICPVRCDVQAFLSTRRLLGEAWATLLAIPAILPSGVPAILRSGETIELGDR
jgi:hypothetical protein